MADFIANQLSRHRGLFFLAALLILTAMTIVLRVPGIDSRLAGYNIEGNPYDSTGRRMAALFANRHTIQVLVKPEETSARTLLNSLRSLENKIENAFPGAVTESLDAAGVPLLRMVKETSPVSEMLEAAAVIPLAGNLVSRDKNSTLVMVGNLNQAEFSTAKFDSLIGLKYPGIREIKAMSLFHIQDSIEDSIKQDYLVILPVIIIFISLSLYLAFGRFSVVLFCMLNVLFSFPPALFFLTVFKVTINQVTASALPVLMILTLSSSVHLVTGYLYGSQSLHKPEKIRDSIRHFFIPSLLSVFTTSIAFGSFVFSDSEYIRQFGIVTAAGLMTVFFLTYLISPFTISIISPEPRVKEKVPVITLLEKILLKYRTTIAAALIVLIAASPFLIPGIKFNTNPETYIPRNSEVHSSTQEIREAFHSLAELDILIERAGEESDISDRGENTFDLAGFTAGFSRKLAGYEEISSVQSFRELAEFEEKYTFLGFPVKIFPRAGNPYVSEDRNTYRINVRLKDPESIKPVLKKIDNDFSGSASRFRYSIFSEFLFFDYISSSITDSLLKSLLMSAVPIIIIILIMALRLRPVLLSLIANLAPLSLLVLLFSAAGLEMNITTSITLVICLGLIVDDTIQILYRRITLKRPLSELGYSVLTTSLLLAGGFFSFILSSSRPNQIFGLLCSVVFLAAAVSDIVFMSWLEKER